MRTLRAVAETLIPAGGGFPIAAGDTAVAERVASYVGRMPRGTEKQIRWLLRGWDALPLASRHLRRFSALRDAERAAWLERCQASPLPWRRAPLVLLKTLCLAAFCADRRVEEALGYTTGPSSRHAVV